MGKFDGWLICSDFDGTIYVNKEISAENCRAVARFQEGGGHFTFASGRFVRMFDEFLPQVRVNAPYIALNGSLIADENTGEILYRGAIDKASTVAYSFDLYDRLAGVTGLTFHSDCTSWCFSRRREAQLDREAFIAGLPDEFTKMIIHVTSESSDRLLDYLGRTTEGVYNISRSWINGIELNGINDSKGYAVLRLKKMLNAKHLVCVGDYENDIDMVRAADIGYAVGSAVPALRAVADRVTVPAAEHAIAAVVADIESMIDEGKA